jgi:kelch-like protein 10
VKGNTACRPTVEEMLTFFDDLQMMKEGREFLTPQFAQQRIPLDVLFAVGGCGAENYTDFIEAYDVRADRWIKVRNTRMN